MTKMWPSVYDPQKIEDSPGEKIIFDRLRNNIECEDWYVFYSFFSTITKVNRKVKLTF